jgi:hypothetical protein
MTSSSANTNIANDINANAPKKSTFKMLTFPCTFSGGAKQSINFYIGTPLAASHPIAFQMKWLGSKGGNVPPHISDALQRLARISKEKNIPFIDLCEYVIANLK